MMMTIDHNNGATLTALKQILVQVAELKYAAEQIPDTADPYSDCGLDSITIIDFLLAIEEQFGVTLVEDRLDASVLKNLSQLAAFVDAQAVRSTN